MSEVAKLAATIFKRAGNAQRFVVAIAGAPGSGKSTIAEQLAALLAEKSAQVVPMDGFHYDDRVLASLRLKDRKGAPETFDFAGLHHLLLRIRAREPDIAIPLFDRELEISRAGAAIIGAGVRFIIVEGNYLLLDEAPWRTLAPLFDLTVFLDEPREELERRLLARWDQHGRSKDDARKWVESNDLPNADRVLAHRRIADIVLHASKFSG